MVLSVVVLYIFLMDPRYVLVSRSTMDDMKKMIERAISYCDRAEPIDYSQPYFGMADDDSATTTYAGATGYSSGTLKTVLHMLNMEITFSDIESLRMIHETEEEQRQVSPDRVSDIFAVSV